MRCQNSARSVHRGLRKLVKPSSQVIPNLQKCSQLQLEATLEMFLRVEEVRLALLPPSEPIAVRFGRQMAEGGGCPCRTTRCLSIHPEAGLPKQTEGLHIKYIAGPLGNQLLCSLSWASVTHLTPSPPTSYTAAKAVGARRDKRGRITGK